MEQEDPTSVVLMMEDFKSFSKAGRSRRQPNRSECLALIRYFFNSRLEGDLIDRSWR